MLRCSWPTVLDLVSEMAATGGDWMEDNEASTWNLGSENPGGGSRVSTDDVAVEVAVAGAFLTARLDSCGE